MDNIIVLSKNNKRKFINNFSNEPEKSNESKKSNKSKKSDDSSKESDKLNESEKLNESDKLNNINNLDENEILDENYNISSPIKKYKCICDNNLCDHQKYDIEYNWNENNPITIKEIKNLNDLISLSTYYHCKMRKEFNGINLKCLHDIKENMEELNKMIGLNNIKEEIVNLIIHLLLLKSSSNNTNPDMLHCVVTGFPGCGKTTFIEIYAKLLSKLGVLKYGHVVKVKRVDLIGKYLGHTAIQTQKKIDDAKGGILLIDEAYSLGNPEQRDSFSKECLDTLNQALSENKQDFICIIAGYANALDSSFFSYNEGLKRRFSFRFDIQPYTSDELGLILNKKIVDYSNWEIKFSLQDLLQVIKSNFKYFTNQGGDMENLFLNIKIIHNKRIFLLPIEEKKKLFIEDIKESIIKFNKLKGNGIDKKQDYLSHLYI